MSIIDAHTHLFPSDLANDRELRLSQDTWFGELFASPKTVIVSPEEMIASMDAAGIKRSVVCGWPWRDDEHWREHNAYLADVARQYPDRISWLAIVNPLSRRAAAEVERCVTAGAAGIGELNADAQAFDWTRTGELAPFVEACVTLDVPVLMHCSEPVGHPYPGKGTATPDKLLTFFTAFPELRVVAAHWGGGLPFYELMPEVASVTRNVVYDTAASTYLYGFDVFPVVERLAGQGRILFASDYPILKQRPFLRRVKESGLSADSLPAVLGSNARRVFKLDDCRGDRLRTNDEIGRST